MGIKSLIISTITALLVGVVHADNCKQGLNYCGYNLLGKGDYFAQIGTALDDAGEDKSDSNNIQHGLFYCGKNGDIVYTELCGADKCTDGGSGESDYCS